MDYFNDNYKNNKSNNQFNIKLNSKYKKKLDYEFNVLMVGEIFKSTNKHLLVGTVDGKIKVYLNNEEIEVLETKGSSIQDLELLDTTKFGSIDVISGDSNGNLVIFSNHQILYRDTINGSITSIINHQLANNDFNLIVGDSLGLLTSIKPHQNTQWRTKIPTINETLNTFEDSDILKINSHINIEPLLNYSNKHQQNIDSDSSSNNTNFNSNFKFKQPSLHIRQIKSVKGYDIYKNKFHYLIVCENSPMIHIFSGDQGKRLCSIPTPSPVNCMCVGYFTNTITKKNIYIKSPPSTPQLQSINSNNNNNNNNNNLTTPNESSPIFTTPDSPELTEEEILLKNYNNINTKIEEIKYSTATGENDDQVLPTQIALGCENGQVYILTQDFKIESYCQIDGGHSITLLNKIKYSDINNKQILPSSNNKKRNRNNVSNINSNNNIEDDDGSFDDIDILICTGNFHSLKMYYNKNLICDHSLDDWVYTLSIGEVENNNDKTIVVGKLDNSIEYLKPIIIINK